MTTAFWVLLTLAMTLQFWLVRRGHFLGALSFSASLWVPWAVFTPLLAWLCARFTIEKGAWRRTIWVHMAASVVLMAGLGWFSYLTDPQPPWRPDDEKRFDPPPPPPRNALEAILRRATFQMPVFWGIVGIAHAFIFHKRAGERERRAAELESGLAQARLHALQMQLNPHFLFNTLNSIASLVHQDPRKADDMIGSLSTLLRRTLQATERQECALKEELELLDGYLEIERTRFGERLRVDKQIEPAALEAFVPVLILQPLVENAIRHGIEGQLKPGVVRVSARREGDWLLLEIADNGRGLARGKPFTEGVGLGNTRARLKELGAGGGTLQIGAPPEGGFLARARLPWRLAPGPAADGDPG